MYVARLSFASFILFLLFIAFTGNVLVMGKDCSEDLGECDADCTPRCKAAHPKALGSCVGPLICRCLFQCKTCTEGLGLGSCDPSQCKRDCAAKHPNRNAAGYCFSVGAPGGNSCMCDYDCW